MLITSYCRVIGGVLTSASSWRATFYLLAAFGGVSFSSFLFFPDGWRKERSQLYQKATRRAIKRGLEHEIHDEKKRTRQREREATRQAKSGMATPVTAEERTAAHSPAPSDRVHVGGGPGHEVELDLVKQEVVVKPRPTRRSWYSWSRGRTRGAAQEDQEEHVKVKLTLADVNPAPAMYSILKRPNNLLAVVCSGESTRGFHTKTVDEPSSHDRPSFRGSVYTRFYGRCDLCSVSGLGCSFR